MSNQGFWNQDWMETQQKYWQSWSDMSRRALGQEEPSKSPWEQALDHWWQALSPSAAEPARDLMEKVMDQGKAFFNLTDMFTRNLGSGGAAPNWGDTLYKTLDDMQKAFSGSGGLTEGDDSIHKMMAFWEMPFDNWQRMASSLSLMPGDALRNMPHEQVKENLHRFLSAPGLGYTREEQAGYQDLVRRTMDYQKVMQEYMQFFSHLGFKSTERMRQHLQELTEQGKPLDSARALYDIWVGSCEEVYGEEVMTPEYAEIHGKLVNALMALKHRMAVMVDETLGAMNMPTRSELRTIQERLQEIRRENKVLRKELDTLKDHVVFSAERSPAAAPRKKTAPRKATAAKAASTRKTGPAKTQQT